MTKNFSRLRSDLFTSPGKMNDDDFRFITQLYINLLPIQYSLPGGLASSIRKILVGDYPVSAGLTIKGQIDRVLLQYENLCSPQVHNAITTAVTHSWFIDK